MQENERTNDMFYLFGYLKYFGGKLYHNIVVKIKYTEATNNAKNNFQ